MAANGITDTEAHALLDTSVATSSTVDLLTAMDTATSTGTLVSGGSYAAATPSWRAAGTPTARQKSNSAAVNFTGMPAVTVVGIRITNPTRRAWFMPLAANRTTAAGDTLSFATDTIVASLVNGT